MIRGNVIRLRPGHWWFELIDATPGREAILQGRCGPNAARSAPPLPPGAPAHRWAEVTAAIDAAKLVRLAAEGLSDTELGDVFGCHARTVLRRRVALGVASQWSPAPAACGTPSGYSAGCRCRACREAHAAAHAAYTARTQASTVSAGRWGEPWDADEDEVLVRLGPVTAAQVLERTYYACAVRLGRLRAGR